VTLILGAALTALSNNELQLGCSDATIGEICSLLLELTIALNI
jgi:hypothetical protein